MNKDHWYDGFIYDRFIAPNQDTAIKVVQNIIPPHSTIIDIGCGTGRFCFKLGSTAKKITGVDLSERNIRTADLNLTKHKNKNINFVHDDAVKFLKNTNAKYDYGIISYMLHETDPLAAREILTTALTYIDNIIIIDYLVPRKKGFWNILNVAVEFAAGKDHYNNFKKYTANNGIHGLLSYTRSRIVNEIKNKPSTSHIVIINPSPLL